MRRAVAWGGARRIGGVGWALLALVCPASEIAAEVGGGIFEQPEKTAATSRIDELVRASYEA